MKNHISTNPRTGRLVRLMNVTLASMAMVLSVSQTVHADEEVGRIEIHTLKSMTLTDQQFLQGRNDGTPVTIAGELRLPRMKMAQYPVVIMAHGSSGVSGYVDDWAQEFNANGIGVFILDSFTGRGISGVNNDQGQFGRLAAVVDVYRALDVLGQHKLIDPKRIALMRFSRGGQVSLYSSMERFQKMHGAGSKYEFAAYLAMYPACGTRYKDDENIVNKPVRIFHGSDDNYNHVAACRSYEQRLRKAGKDVVLYEYAGAQHVFDYKKLNKPIVMKKAQTTRNCVLVESGDGKILNAQSGQRFTYADPCVEFGPTIAFNQEAYSKAKQTINEFTNSLFKLN